MTTFTVRPPGLAARFLDRLAWFRDFVRAVIRARKEGGAVFVRGLSRREFLAMSAATGAVAAWGERFAKQLEDSLLDTSSTDGAAVFDMNAAIDALDAVKKNMAGPEVFLVHPADYLRLVDGDVAMRSVGTWMGVPVVMSEAVPAGEIHTMRKG
jgi:hypothetical protein